MPSFDVTTARLSLRPLSAEAFDALLAADARALTAATGARFPEPIAPPPLMDDVIPFLRDRLRAAPDELGWWSWLVTERATHAAVGSVGFGGKPNADGAVIIGYATYGGFEGRGFATEAVAALIAWAFEHDDVTRVCATVPQWNTSSLRVAEKVGMRQVGTIWEEELGEEVLFFAIERSSAERG